MAVFHFESTFMVRADSEEEARAKVESLQSAILRLPDVTVWISEDAEHEEEE